MVIYNSLCNIISLFIYVCIIQYYAIKEIKSYNLDINRKLYHKIKWFVEAMCLKYEY